jgi:hypothetical protein
MLVAVDGLVVIDGLIVADGLAAGFWAELPGGCREYWT